ncbi:hypothetical protein ARMSODRAFT_1022659 [Armillaria solidipes]|uniref:Uncharacterized protein n=1 Tax=Armillaria solidipes TaxID=1076256 RepID=A0A2H3BM35_9AGAR|nr:hypothetical protein ARMSODRAFT_1022659 [Armillaria solidipes]
MHLSYEDFYYDGGLLRSPADYDSGCSSHAKQTNTSSGSSGPGGGKPVYPPKGTGQSGGSAGSANNGGSGKP